MADLTNTAPQTSPKQAPSVQDQPVNAGTKKVEEIISAGDLEAGFNRLYEFSGFLNDQNDEVAQFQSRLATVEKEFDKGKITVSEKLLQTNQIADGFLHFIQELKREILRTFSFGGTPVLAGKFKNQSDILQIVTEELLHGRYTILGPITGGKSGFFFKAFSDQLRQNVVLKVFKITNIEELPKEEMEAVLKLKHRNIIRIVDHNFERLPAYVILEFINGITLDDAIELFRGFPLPEALRVTRHLISALAYVRKRGIRHANIRPSKIYIDDEGLPMISSLDIIKQDKDALRSLSRFKEECRYLSPEALNETLDYEDLEAVERSDQFSIGLILLEMLTAQPLLRGETVQDIFDDRRAFFANPNKRLEDLLKMRSLRVPLAKAIKKMLSEKPEGRYSDLADALEVLKNIRDSAPTNCQAFAAYEVVKNRHHTLVNGFYQRFFKRIHRDVRDDFKNPERQDMMLRKSIEVVLGIESPEKEAAFLNILARPIHAGYSAVEYYKIFLDTLRDHLLDLLPHDWPHKGEAADAWEDKIRRCLMLVEQHLLHQKEEAAKHFLSSDTTVG